MKVAVKIGWKGVKTDWIGGQVESLFPTVAVNT